MAKAGIVENHTLQVIGKMEVKNNEIHLTEVEGTEGELNLASLVTSFDECYVTIAVKKRNEITQNNEDEE